MTLEDSGWLGQSPSVFTSLCEAEGAETALSE
jgi:hypothetical protein